MKKKLMLNKRHAVLDVGGKISYWFALPQFVGQIDILNMYPVEYDPDAHTGYNIRISVGNGCHLDFPDHSYSLVHSNSVIEHVGGWDQQKLFASETLRVGRSIWVQTPAKSFFIDPHYLSLFIHWLPKSIQKKTIRWFSLYGLIQKPSPENIAEVVDHTTLLSHKDMTKLFPDCEILTERFMFLFPKSYIAIRKSMPKK